MKKVIVIFVVLVMFATSNIAFAISDISNLPTEEKTAIQELVDQGVLSGYTDGTFRPKEALQRQHFAKYIVNALGLQPINPVKPTFPDATPDMALYAYVEAAAKAGLIKGTASGTFEPTRSLKKGEAAVIIVRALEGAQGTYSTQVARAKELGLIGSNEDPGAIANRGGAAVSISKGIEIKSQVPVDPSPPPAPKPDPTPAPAPTPTPGTRLNPLAIDQPVIFDGMDTLFDTYKVELTLMEIVRGDSALTMAKQGNMYNSTPPAGKEYLFAKFRVRTIESKNDESIDIYEALFDLYSQSGVKYGDFVSVAGLQYEFTEAFAGAELFGYACFYVDVNDENPTIVFLKRNNGGIWFKGSQTQVTTNNDTEDTSQALGGINNKDELQSFLNANYSTLVTSGGPTKFTFDIHENDSIYSAYDYWIQVEYDLGFFLDVSTSIKYTNEQRETIKQELKDFMEKIARSAIAVMPSKKLYGGYFQSWYRYPTLEVDLIIRKYYSWTNYDQPPLGTLDAYNTAKPSTFRWWNLIDDKL